MQTDARQDQWLVQTLDRLAARSVCGYRDEASAWTEPTALAALALLAHGRAESAVGALNWLEDRLDNSSGVGMSATQRTPGWPTGLALLAWSFAQTIQDSWADRYAAAIARAEQAILSWSGERLEPNEFVSHDCTLVGWSWIDQTHSWVEPTAIQTLALKQLVQQRRQLLPGDHPQPANAKTRIAEAATLLWDRQLPHGGWNYGNTLVLKQELRPHLLPTGLALLALADEPDAARRAAPSLAYLARELGALTSPMSLGYGVLALTEYGRRPAAADWWLEFAAQRATGRRASPVGWALLCLAASQNQRPFGIALGAGSQATDQVSPDDKGPTP